MASKIAIFSVIMLVCVIQSIDSSRFKREDKKENLSAEETKKPTEETKKPTEQTKKPTEETKKPTEETKKPTEQTKKPSEETKKTPEETKKPTDETKKPTDETEKPNAETKNPSENKDKLPADFLKGIEKLREILNLKEFNTKIMKIFQA